MTTLRGEEGEEAMKWKVRFCGELEIEEMAEEPDVSEANWMEHMFAETELAKPDGRQAPKRAVEG